MRVTSSAKASFKVVDVLIERFGWGVGSQKSKDFACFTYHPALPNLKNVLMSKWHLIQNQPLLREIYNEPPIISYKRAKPLGDTCILVRTKLQGHVSHYHEVMSRVWPVNTFHLFFFLAKWNARGTFTLGIMTECCRYLYGAMMPYCNFRQFIIQTGK